MTPTPPNEAEMLRRACDGDADALAQLVKRFGPPLLRFIAQLTGDAAYAQDAVQDIFLQVHQARAPWDERAQPSTWLFGIAYRKAADRQRRRAIEQRAMNELEARQLWRIQTAVEAPLEALLLGELFDVAQRHLATLPAADRDMFLLRLEGLTFDDIAAQTGVSGTTVKSRIAKITETLRKLL